MAHKYDWQPGRVITRDGVPFVIIGKCDGTNPLEADDFVKLIVELLNSHVGNGDL